jgi:hypothetical protein
VDINKRKQEAHARRETNASRQARIARTVEDTYTHKYEVIGGGGYLRFRSGSQLKRNNEISWNTAFNYYFNPKLAVIGEAQGSFGNAKALINNTYGVAYPQINEYFFMGGASYRFYRKERFAVSAQALGGMGWGIFSGASKAIPATYLGLWQSGVRPAVQIGVSGDYNFYPNLASALRLPGRELPSSPALLARPAPTQNPAACRATSASTPGSSIDSEDSRPRLE